MKRAGFIVAVIIELTGIGALAAALVEGMGENPGTYLALLGGFLIAAGGFLFNKCLKMG